ncbi:MAG: response regulator [Candidatus Heimdallarchaeota archaeon]|nr:response regulator [Candidatus Heimdallarchaeota archaeon]
MDKKVDHQILLLDDQPHITYILKKFLDKRYKVLIASSILQAETILSDKTCEVSVAFIDYNLKDTKDGIDFAKSLRENYPLMRVIMISGASSYEIAIKALNSGVINALINKPFAFNEIQKTLDDNLKIWTKNYEALEVQVNNLAETGEFDHSELEKMDLSIPHLMKIIKSKAALRSQNKFDLLGFGITRGDKILMKYFIDKSLQARYTSLFAQFIQTLSILNFDLFVEADSHKLEELILEDISIIFRSVNTLNYSVFIKGEPPNKNHVAEKVNEIASQLSLYSSPSTEVLTDSVKDVMINQFKEFRNSFSYQ